MTRSVNMDLYNHDNHPAPYYHECSINFGTDLLKRDEQVKLATFGAMNALEGWCTKFKASILIDLVFMKKAQTIVEIGVWGGKSLIPLAFAVKERKGGMVYGIDPWSREDSVKGMTGINEKWWGSVNHEAVYQRLVQKIIEFQLEDCVTLIRSTSENAPQIPDIDILHIDGNHSETSSLYDVKKWAPLVKSGGLIIFDDTTWGTTDQAVEWLNENCCKLGEYHEDNNYDWGIWVKI
jgi:predicted O-methyltransferase YrrM